MEEKINFALYPSLQGGPHNNHIAALAIALKQVATPEYKVYMQQARKNAQALASALLKRKCRLVTDGTDNHLLLWDLTALGLLGIHPNCLYFCFNIYDKKLYYNFTKDELSEFYLDLLQILSSVTC